MIAPIEAGAQTPYEWGMRCVLLRLIALMAVLLMPLGMSAAPAASAPSHVMASMTMQHCPDQDSKSHSNGAFTECTMACSAALPAAECLREQPPAIVCAPVPPGREHALQGLHPDTATPPPRIS